ncbi:hypothetical protein EEL51_03495 [Muribaculaceae bacterium Isolate-110 (HZI)]|nr:hypothetical protein EEL51_03495 [Muribaculaceae bacterium Isolate-110 (HZI)]
MEEKVIIALEIGSSKIKGAIGTVSPDGALNVKAVEEEPISDIVRYGCIRNIVETERAVRNVINSLELRETPRKIQGVYLSVGGRSLTSQPVEIERHLPSESIISEEIIQDITREALDVPLNERSIVTVTPRELLVDNEVTPRPIGVMGSHIVARLNLVSCRTQLLRNLSVVIEERLGLKIMDTFARPIALAELVLLNEEKKLGCMLVDFGAETTTVAIYKGGMLLHLAVLPMGSRNITRDITTLNYLEEQAEELKKTGGSAFPTLDAPHASGQPDFVAINNYVSARAGEIIINITEQIKYAGLTPEKLPEGIIIVGNGAKLNGFNQRLEQISGLKVRLGAPGNRLRILDGRIHSVDSVDVLSILNTASRQDPQECLSERPAPVAQPPVVEQPTATPQATPQQPMQQQQPLYPQQHVGGSTDVRRPTPTGTDTPPRPVPPVVPTTTDTTANTGKKKTNIFKQGYNNLVNRVARIISDGFEEEEDEE